MIYYSSTKRFFKANYMEIISLIGVIAKSNCHEKVEVLNVIGQIYAMFHRRKILKRWDSTKSNLKTYLSNVIRNYLWCLERDRINHKNKTVPIDYCSLLIDSKEDYILLKTSVEHIYSSNYIKDKVLKNY